VKYHTRLQSELHGGIVQPPIRLGQLSDHLALIGSSYQPIEDIPENGFRSAVTVGSGIQCDQGGGGHTHNKRPTLSGFMLWSVSCAGRRPRISTIGEPSARSQSRDRDQGEHEEQQNESDKRDTTMPLG